MAADDGAKGLSGSGELGCCLFFTMSEAAELAGRLVEPGSDVFLPVFTLVDVGDNVVVLHGKGGMGLKLFKKIFQGEIFYKEMKI